MFRVIFLGDIVISKMYLVTTRIAGLGLAALVAAGCVAPPSRPAPPAPHVVVIVMDTVRADYLSAYGYGRPTSPTFDRLAGESTAFRRAFATTFWTLPSHASLFSGRYPGEVGATSETLHLPDTVETMAERLRDRGYRTVGVSSNPWISAERGFAQGFEELDETWRDDPRRPGDQPDPWTAQRAASWIADTDTDPRPLFLFVNFNRAHLPYDPAPTESAEFVRPRVSPQRMRQLRQIHGPWGHLAGAVRLDEDDLEVLRDLYAAEVRHVDASLHTVVDALDRAGILDDTLLIVTSDHGENLGDHGRMGHTLSMYDTTLRVPLLIRKPGLCATEWSDDLVSLTDVLPTVLAAIGVDGGTIDLCSPTRRGHERLYAENDRPVKAVELMRQHFPDFDVDSIDYPLRAVREPGRKLIWHVERRIEYYDLVLDPDELVDRSKADAAAVAGLHEDLVEWSARNDSVQSPEQRQLEDEEAIERLRSLGYLGGGD